MAAYVHICLHTCIIILFGWVGQIIYTAARDKQTGTQAERGWLNRTVSIQSVRTQPPLGGNGL